MSWLIKLYEFPVTGHQFSLPLFSLPDPRSYIMDRDLIPRRLSGDIEKPVIPERE